MMSSRGASGSGMLCLSHLSPIPEFPFLNAYNCPGCLFIYASCISLSQLLSICIDFILTISVLFQINKKLKKQKLYKEQPFTLYPGSPYTPFNILYPICFLICIFSVSLHTRIQTHTYALSQTFFSSCPFPPKSFSVHLLRLGYSLS